MCACEVLIATPAARNLIREGKTHQLYTVMQTGGQHGMQTMNSCLADLVQATATSPRNWRCGARRCPMSSSACCSSGRPSRARSGVGEGVCTDVRFSQPSRCSRY